MTSVALFFVASPLQYLAAKQIAKTHEASSKCVLVWYQPGISGLVNANDWDASAFMPSPRHQPLPGTFGRHRRILDNLRLVDELVGTCDELRIHSAVFDTETINYFLSALPKRVGAQRMQARILPDGLISIRRYPLSFVKRALQHLRHVRTVFSPELRYTTFTGDRIGSDAAFCDRIYVLPNLPHEYPKRKVVQLNNLVEGGCDAHQSDDKRALVIGQPMVGAGLMTEADRDQITQDMAAWLRAQGITHIDYKAHPKDPHGELSTPDYELLDITEPIEVWMTRRRYDVVVGTRSTALMFAAQLYAPQGKVLAFGWPHIRFKSEDEKRAMTAAFKQSGVTLVD